MSCGDPHETDCSEVLAEVWMFLDRECDQERRAVLQQHLDECSPCLERFGIEQQLKALLVRKCGGEKAPDELRARLRESIRRTVVRQAQVTVEQTESGRTTVEVRTQSVEVREQP